jgi:cell division protein FtsB
VIGAVVLLFIALLAAAGLKGYRDLTAARARERQLATRVDDTKRSIEQLRGRIERLKSDPAMLERLAREELGMVKARDVVIELPPGGLEEPPPAAVGAATPARPALPIDPAKPAVSINQAKPVVSIGQAKPAVPIGQAKPALPIDQAKPAQPIDQAHSPPPGSRSPAPAPTSAAPGSPKPPLE